MAMVHAKCINCGAVFNVDDTLVTDVCPLCKCSFAVEIAIEEFKTANPVTRSGEGQKSSAPSAASAAEAGAETNPEDFTMEGGTLVKYVGTAMEVTVPEGVEIIGQNAFWGCRDLYSVILPETVKEIQTSAFFGCGELTKINLPNSIISIGNNAFEDCATLAEAVLPSSLAELGERAFRGCHSLRSVVIPNTVTAIREDTFRGCSSLMAVAIPNSVEEIGEDAFRGCAALARVIIPNSVTTVGMGAFIGCSMLSSVTIPDSVVNVSAGVFGECPALKEIIASDAWKTAHWQVAKCLESYDPSKKKGCYIATAVYGSYDCPEVWTLRRFRDGVLAKSAPGRAFIRTYYALSPGLVRRFGDSPRFRRFWRARLDALTARLRAKGVESTPYEDRDW